MRSNVTIQFDPRTQDWTVVIRVEPDGRPDPDGTEVHRGEGKTLEDAARSAGFAAGAKFT